jgi:hypothetical protein
MGMKMPKKRYDFDEVNISFKDLVKLRGENNLNLGIVNEVATTLANTPGMGPKKTSANIAFHFWNWVGFIGLGYTIYLSFVSDWWWFIIGFIGLSIIWKANKKGNAQNYLDAAFIDKAFYERVCKIKGWFYEIDESIVDNYRN